MPAGQSNSGEGEVCIENRPTEFGRTILKMPGRAGIDMSLRAVTEGNVGGSENKKAFDFSTAFLLYGAAPGIEPGPYSLQERCSGTKYQGLRANRIQADFRRSQ